MELIMPYEHKAPVYKLVFDDMEGLEVRAHGAPMGALMGMVKLADMKERGARLEDLKALDDLFHSFADSILSWTLQKNGEDVPPSLESLYAQDQQFVLALIKGWVEAVGGVPGPLGKPSSSGEPSLEDSIPMAASSLSQAS